MTKNPITMLAIGWGAPVGGGIVGGILGGITGLGFLSTLLWLAGAVVAGHFLKKLIDELKTLSADNELSSSLMYVPGLNQVLCFLKAPALVDRMRRARSIQSAAKPQWMYLIVPWYAIAADLNDAGR